MERTSTILQPATETTLTMLATVKDELQITNTADDVYLTRRIGFASADIATRCGRTFGLERVQDVFSLDPWGRDPILARPPLRDVRPLVLSRNMLASVESVSVQGVTLPSTQWDVDLATGLLYQRGPNGRTHWMSYPITVAFTSGWLLPGNAARNLPGGVEDVCSDMVVADYCGRGRDPAIVDEIVDGAGRIKYKESPTDALDVRLTPFVVRV